MYLARSCRELLAVMWQYHNTIYSSDSLTSSPQQWYIPRGLYWKLWNIPTTTKLQAPTITQCNPPCILSPDLYLWSFPPWCCRNPGINNLNSNQKNIPRVTSKLRLPVSSWILLMMSETSMSVGLWPHRLMAAWSREDFQEQFIWERLSEIPEDFHKISCRYGSNRRRWKPP